MRITLLNKNPAIYTCNSYHIRGDWNAMPDVNTLIDIGSDDYILSELEEIYTGVGKRRVEQIILTHEHFDHSSGLMSIKNKYSPVVMAFKKNNGIDKIVFDGMRVKIGDRAAEIIHTPWHSNDSICIYCDEEKTLFCGDTQLNIKTVGGSFNSGYIHFLERLIKIGVKVIYSGHDKPITMGVTEMLKHSLNNVLKSNILN